MNPAESEKHKGPFGPRVDKVKGYTGFFAGLFGLLTALLNPGLFLYFKPIGLSGPAWGITIIWGIWMLYSCSWVWARHS